MSWADFDTQELGNLNTTGAALGGYIGYNIGFGGLMFGVEADTLYENSSVGTSTVGGGSVNLNSISNNAGAPARSTSGQSPRGRNLWTRRAWNSDKDAHVGGLAPTSPRAVGAANRAMLSAMAWNAPASRHQPRRR